jgi:hypothetical protein
MSELIESPGNEIAVEFPGLSAEERDELETFLTAQPEVQDVRRRYQVRDHAPGQDTLGLITHVVYHLALELAKGVVRTVAANVILKRLKAGCPSFPRSVRKGGKRQSRPAHTLGSEIDEAGGSCSADTPVRVLMTMQIWEQPASLPTNICHPERSHGIRKANPMAGSRDLLFSTPPMKVDTNRRSCGTPKNSVIPSEVEGPCVVRKPDHSIPLQSSNRVPHLSAFCAERWETRISTR